MYSGRNDDKAAKIFRTVMGVDDNANEEEQSTSPRVRLKNMEWFKNPEEVEVNYAIDSSNPNNMMFKSPRTILVTKFDKDEIVKMRKNPRFLSQSLEFKTPKAEQSNKLAMSPSVQN